MGAPITDPAPQQHLTEHDASAELKAAVGARRELGGEIEDQVVEAFLARVERRINLQVDQRLAQSSGAAPRGRDTRPIGIELVAAPLALAIPLVAIAGGTVGVWGVIAVMAAVALIVTLTFVDRWR